MIAFLKISLFGVMTTLVAFGVLLSGCKTHQSQDVSGENEVFSVESVRGEKRPIVIYGPSDDVLVLQDAKVDWSGFADRNIVFWIVDGQTASRFENGRSTLLPANAAKVLQERFSGDEPLVLVGKDGGAKLRGAILLSTEEIFATIDAMPMRQDEMKR